MTKDWDPVVYTILPPAAYRAAEVMGLDMTWLRPSTPIPARQDPCQDCTCPWERGTCTRGVTQVAPLSE